MLQQRVMGARPALAASRRAAPPACARRAAPARQARAAAAPAAAAAAGLRLPAARRAPLRVAAAASGAGALPMPNSQPAQPPAPAAGVKLVPAAISVGLGLIVNFLIPAPEGVTAQAWRLFAIFVSTICGAPRGGRLKGGPPCAVLAGVGGAALGSPLRAGRAEAPGAGSPDLSSRTQHGRDAAIPSLPHAASPHQASSSARCPSARGRSSASPPSSRPARCPSRPRCPP
jgi:hypothetical protein